MSGAIFLLFRRRCPAKASRDFVRRFLGDAMRVASADSMRLGALYNFEVCFGPQVHLDDHGKEIQNARPVYWWARFETFVISEDRRIPAKFCRNARGLLTPRYI